MNEVALLLRLLDDSYEKKAWQGPNLRGSLRGVTAQVAAFAVGEDERERVRAFACEVELGELGRYRRKQFGLAGAL